MKKFAALALLFGIGLFAAACDKAAEKKPMDAAPPATDAPAAAPADAAPAEPAK